MDYVWADNAYKDIYAQLVTFINTFEWSCFLYFISTPVKELLNWIFRIRIFSKKSMINYIVIINNNKMKLINEFTKTINIQIIYINKNQRNFFTVVTTSEIFTVS